MSARKIVTPLLKQLGYGAGTDFNIIREQSLRYPHVYIGTKKPNRDPLIRGSADYICDVKQTIRWVIEAKRPDIELGLDEVEQAYSYANHPEIRAVYFCVTNGREFKFYLTHHGPEADAVLSIKYGELNQSLQVIENLVGPSALLRDFPRRVLDLGKPIAPGLRSVARITGGHIIFRKNSLNAPQLNGITTAVESGAVERNKDNHLIAYFHTRSPFQAFQDLNERLGLADFETFSPDECLSTEAMRPTLFTASQKVILAKGEKLLDIRTWKEGSTPL